MSTSRPASCPTRLRERYWFHARPEQPFNHIVDISGYVGGKIDAIVECRSQGDGNAGSLLRARLAKEGRRLPLLGGDDRTADRAYARQFLLDEFRAYARGRDFEYAERFYYSGPPEDRNAKVEEYLEKNAVKI